MQFFQHYKRIHGHDWCIYYNVVDYEHIKKDIDDTVIVVILSLITIKNLVDPVACKENIYKIIQYGGEETQQSQRLDPPDNESHFKHH